MTYSENSPVSGRYGVNGLFNQWGGKLSFFFTYTHFSNDLITGLLAGMLPFIKQDLGIDYLRAGLLLSAFTFTAGFSQFFGGWLSDRISPRIATSMGLGGVGLSAVTIEFTGSFYPLLIALIAMGIFAGFYHPAAVSTLTNKFEEERRGKVVSLHMVGGSLGFGVGPFLGAIIATRFNWHVTFLLLGLFTFIAAPLAFIRLKSVLPDRSRDSQMKSQTPGQKKISIWKAFKTVLDLYLISTALQLIVVPIISFIPLFLVEVHHLSEAASSMWLTVVRMGGLLGSLAGGWLIDRWGRRKTIFLNLLLFGPILYLLVVLPFNASFVLILILLGCLFSMREATMQTYLMDNTAAYMRGTVFGVYFGFGQLGQSITQPLAGDFMDSFGILEVFNGIALTSIGLSAIAVILIVRHLRHPRPAV